MRIVVTGAAGMLGQDVTSRLSTRHDISAVDRAQVDITVPDEVGPAIEGADVVVNCAAYTAVDDAETHEGEAFAINALGPGVLARACAAAGVRLVHISTDYVFDGAATAPYPHDATPRPRSAYGRTKLAGEWAIQAAGGDHLILRTAWLYGAGGGCFPRTIARVAAARDHLDVVADQHGAPTWTVDVADLIARLVEGGAPRGIYHATAGGETTWYDFARATVTAAGLDAGIVHPVTSEAFPRPAARPAYSVLGHEALRAIGVQPIGEWHERWLEAAPSVLAATG